MKLTIPGIMDGITMPLIIIADQRTGTNFTRDLLASSKIFYNCGEVFQTPGEVKNSEIDDVNFYSFRKKCFIENLDLSLPSRQNIEFVFFAFLRMITERDPRIPLIDIKYNSTHALNNMWKNPTEPPQLFQLCHRYDLPILHIWRKNTFRAYLSHQLALRSEQYTAFDPEDILSSKITIDPKHMFAELKVRESGRNAVTNWLNQYRLKYHSIAYEDFSESIEVFCSAMKPILYDLLKVELPDTLATHYQKLVKRVADRIENVDEVRQALVENGREELVDF